MTESVAKTGRKWPCWLIGHRPEAKELEGEKRYEETCPNCHSVRFFSVDERGRHNGSWRTAS